jgi:hypothetical protein
MCFSHAHAQYRLMEEPAAVAISLKEQLVQLMMVK